MKTRPEGAEFFHADRRADMTKLTVAFRNFAKVPKNGRLRYIWKMFHTLTVLEDELLLLNLIQLHLASE